VPERPRGDDTDAPASANNATIRESTPARRMNAVYDVPMYSVLTLNPIAKVGLSRLPGDRYRVSGDITDPDAILVRSADMHKREIPASLKAVGRAGAGVNNIPIAKMTERGIPVFNAPGANANAVKELVLAGLLLACRHICEGWDFARRLEGSDEEMSKTVEGGKKAFAGYELAGKTLVVIGLGAIGRLVANTGQALGMTVVGFDPALTVEGASQLSASVKRVATVDAALSAADFVTVHVPLMDATRHLVNADRLRAMRRGVVVLNFAREGIVDEAAIVAGIDAGHVGGYVSDFPTTLTKNHKGCVTLPHLGASTAEAEDNCAIMVADQVRDFLDHGNIKNAVNFPEVQVPRSTAHRLVCASISAPDVMGQISKALGQAGLGLHEIVSMSRGELIYTVADLTAAPAATITTQVGAVKGVVMARMVG
jgi:D-3-phosphoglycerate dehydrogenase